MKPHILPRIISSLIALSAAAEVPPAPVGPATLSDNQWVELPAGPGNAYVNPVYDPGTKQLVMLLADGNGTAHLDPASGQWRIGLAPSGGAVGGDQPLLKNYALKDGRPNFRNMLIYHMTAYDSKRQRIIAGATRFMASYDAAAKTWTDLGAKVELFGQDYAGVPPVAWGAMCYDPVNDEIVLMPGGAVYNFDHWEKDREVTGELGTFIYSGEKNRWTRPMIGPESFYKARDLIRPVRLALQSVMSEIGEAIVLERNGQTEEAARAAAKQAAAIRRVAADLKTLATGIRALGSHERLAAGAAKIAEAAERLTPEGAPDDIHRAQSEALRLLQAARHEDLWSHPPFRALSRMVYLPDRKAILLFGGHNQSRMLNDTWLYDCEKREWFRQAPKTLPRARMMHTLVYHGGLGKAVLAGGYETYWFDPRRQAEQVREEVWTYDADADDWTLVLKEFPFKRGEPSYFAEYCPTMNAIVLVRGGKETFALRLAPGPALDAPAAEAVSAWQDNTPVFVPPREDPEIVARWKALPANTWVPADPPGNEPGEYGWGMTGFNGRLHAVVLWGGGHSTHQANDIQLYFPGANRWVTGYAPQRIDIPPWNKGCGNPGGVDRNGGIFNLHARRGIGGNGGGVLINMQIFSPYWYGPKALLNTPESWGRTTTFEYDLFARRWRMPLPATGADGMCYPYNAKNTTMAVNVNGARRWDSAAGDWQIVSDARCPVAVNTGEGASNLYIEKRNRVVVVGPVGKEPAIQTWALDIAAGTWKNLEPKGAPPGRPSALAYCETDDAIYAGCFTGHGVKSREGQEAVYCFRRNAWTMLPATVQDRVIPRGQPWRPTTMGAHHSAWTKIAYSPRYNLLMSHREGAGMWVMRPEFSQLNWE